MVAPSEDMKSVIEAVTDKHPTSEVYCNPTWFIKLPNSLTMSSIPGHEVVSRVKDLIISVTLNTLNTWLLAKIIVLWNFVPAYVGYPISLQLLGSCLEVLEDIYANVHVQFQCKIYLNFRKKYVVIEMQNGKEDQMSEHINVKNLTFTK